MRLKSILDISNVKSQEDLTRFAAQALKDIADILNGKVGIEDNTDSIRLTVNFTAANVAQTIQHNLGHMPSGYVLIGSTVAMSVYDGGTAFTDKFIYLKASAIGTARILLY